MSNTLQVPGTTHAKVIVAPPAINLRRAAAYNAQDRGPLSSSSATFNFNHLLFSPPPSPGLPALVPRRKRRVSNPLKARPSRLARLTFYLISLFIGGYLVVNAIRSRGGIDGFWLNNSNEDNQMMGLDSIPRYPTPFIVPDIQGQTRWTVSIPPDTKFPPSSQEMMTMNNQCQKVSARTREMYHKGPLATGSSDEFFLDVEEAETQGLLRTHHGKLSKETGRFAGVDTAAMKGMSICKKSMTFVLEGDDAGLGNTLMMLWTFYGLAKKEGRTFFVEDSRWAYGKYSDVFDNLPSPKCQPPARHHMLPCPSQARHLIVSSSSAQDSFPELFAKYRRTSGTNDEARDLWDLARSGYDSLFALHADDSDYVETRIQDMKNKAITDFTSPNTPIVGLHIRRGDRHPKEYQYKDTYIPADIFHQSAQKAANAHFGDVETKGKPHEALLVLASDDPTVHEEPDLQRAMVAQDRIKLASKTSMTQKRQPVAFIHKFIEEAFGWEGGFFATLFWNLGTESKNNAANAPKGVETGIPEDVLRRMASPSDSTMQLRAFIGRAYMMDLAVIAGASDSIVCAVSAMGCRLLGVMMDWESGVKGGHWINVDQGYQSWQGIDW
ncbi:hypothetical protein V2G26_014532 [Clonostachys chloroleuca]